MKMSLIKELLPPQRERENGGAENSVWPIRDIFLKIRVKETWESVKYVEYVV